MVIQVTYTRCASSHQPAFLRLVNYAAKAVSEHVLQGRQPLSPKVALGDTHFRSSAVCICAYNSLQAITAITRRTPAATHLVPHVPQLLMSALVSTWVQLLPSLDVQ